MWIQVYLEVLKFAPIVALLGDMRCENKQYLPMPRLMEQTAYTTRSIFNVGSAWKLATWNGSEVYFQCSPRQSPSPGMPVGNSRDQWHEMYCHDLEVMSSNPDRAELGVRGISVLSRTWAKISYPGRWCRNSACIPLRHCGPNKYV